MTTLGIGDISPARYTILVKFLVTSEVLIGLYFWAALVGTIIGWTISEAKNDKSKPKSGTPVTTERGDDNCFPFLSKISCAKLVISFWLG